MEYRIAQILGKIGATRYATRLFTLMQFNFYLSNTSILYIVFWHAKAPDLLVAAYMGASFVGGWEYVKTEWTQKLRLLSLLAIGQTCMP